MTEKSHQDLLQIIRYDPGNYLVWLLLGWTANSRNMATYYFHKALETRPGDAVATDGLDWASSAEFEQQIAIYTNANFLPLSSQEAKEAGLRPTILDINRQPDPLLTTARPARAESIHNAVATQPDVVLSQYPLEQIKKIQFSRMLIFTTYIFGITLAEVLTTLFSPEVGLVCHGILLFILLIHSASSQILSIQRMLLTLSVAPLIRIVSLSIPVNDAWLSFYNLIFTGVPLLISTFMVVRYTGLKFSEVGLRLSNWPVQILVGFSGLGLGYLEFLILRPEPLISSLTLIQVWLPALIILVFTGFLEEFIFRGVMQKAFVNGLGRLRGVLYISILFSILHVGYHSILDMIFVFIVALFFGYIVLRTKSILGVALAHGLTNIFLFLVIPFLVS